MGVWTKKDFGGVKFNDERLNKRFSRLVEQLSEGAGGSIQLACEDWASVKAAYRFFDNPKVNSEAIIGAHIKASTRRVSTVSEATTAPILAVQDTTFFNYSRHPKTKGLGEISKFIGNRGETLKTSGIILHSSLALSPEGVPLGILSQKLWTRTKPTGLITKSGKNATRIPIEDKESFRWIEAMRNVCEKVKDPRRVIHVGDRESDIFEFFHEAKKLNTHFLIRIRNHSRCLKSGGKLFDPISSTASKGKYELTVNSKTGKERIATIEVKYYPVTILPSIDKKKLKPVKAWVISAIEKNPPKKEDAIDWKLLTDMKVSSFKDALKKIDWYKKRWQIEVYHKVLKSGCKVLDCRLRTFERLSRYVALMTVVAWRIFWMSMVGRRSPDLNPKFVFTNDELKAMQLYVKKKSKTNIFRLNANDWIRKLATLGGFSGRKSDGDPGPLVLWRGYLRLQDIMLGVSLSAP